MKLLFGWLLLLWCLLNRGEMIIISLPADGENESDFFLYLIVIFST